MYQNHQESQDKDSGFYAAKNETKFSTFNRQMESLFNSLEDNNPDKKAYYSGDSLYSNPLGKSRIQSPEIKLQIDIPDLQDGYGNVVVNSISPVFTSNPILPIRSPSLSVSARSANNRNSQDSSFSFVSRDNPRLESSWINSNHPNPQESSWITSPSHNSHKTVLITPPNSNPPSKRTSISSVNSNSLKSKVSRPTSPLLIPSESLGRSNSLSVGRSDSRASISKAFESKILGLGRSNSLSGTYSKPRMSISRAFGSSFLSRSNSRASSVNTVISDENSLCSAPGRSPRPISPAAYRFDDILPYSPSQTILNPTSQKTFDEIITNYSPTRVPRRSLDESKRTPFKILTTLNPIDEEPLKRTLSLPTTRSCHSTIFTTTLYKKSTKGLYQKRIVRFDGSTFVCMSSTLTTNPDSSLDRILLAREIQPTCKLFFKPKFQVRVEEMTITEGGREWFKVSNGREKIKFRVGDGVMKQVLRRVLVERWSDILTNLQGDIVTVIEDVKGIKVISGVVERVPRFVRRVERIRNSRDIERSIVEIDEEMSALGL